jgi:LPS O-antigen subunit length determinant protein (WzzB/FepE family)
LVLFSRVLQGSIEKKKNVLKTATNKDVRVSSIHKNSDTASKANLDKPVSIFNNEHLNVFEASEFKAKKYNNRKLDKLVSLIQYMVSSSEKAMRYISSTNF